MIFDAAQDFTLPYPGPQSAALAFLRDPGRSLRAVRFLRGLVFDGRLVRAEMVVPVPMLGDLSLPFESEVVPTDDGARLVPRPLSGRAWVEVGGVGVAEPRGDAHAELRYTFSFRAHLEVPTAQRWGGAAFEKMFQASARRTLERVATEFPEGLRAAMP